MIPSTKTMLPLKESLTLVESTMNRRSLHRKGNVNSLLTGEKDINMEIGQLAFLTQIYVTIKVLSESDKV